MLKRFKNFKDPDNRVSEKPSDFAHGITDNPLLFTGEAYLLESILGNATTLDTVEIVTVLKDCFVFPGVYSRHKASLREKYKLPINAVSHDEYNGLMFIAAANQDAFSYLAPEIVKYGKKYNWQYSDLYPTADFFSYLKSKPIKAINELIAYFKDLKSSEDTNSVDLRHSADVTAFTRLRQPRDVAFYKLAAGETPTAVESIWLAVSTVLTCRGDVYRKNGGTVLMAWFRMIALKRLESLGVCRLPFIVSKAHEYFEKTLVAKTGAVSYPELLTRRYFHLTSLSGEKHPMIDLVEEYCRKF